ncbi:hypothetical protein [Luteolibacter luteus]|uniref:Uncharacterized protein n=1 Tax=Luteolibacter luteus TaxID=2728835 RepID=A0A858RDD6_9BACT|nr:hypothetical protein [Luteolibacter luteus]QJE94409.1 hypothetical protein HHL09_00940 [Luteolibacter luteus]
MPYTPFARFLAIALVVLCGVGLLWPDDRAVHWMFYALGAVPVLLGIFTVSAVRSAPPFDDRSFHRGLPLGDGYAFFRVVWIHLLVPAGIALLVLTYCLLMNFGWRAMIWGILMFTLPVWALCSALGLAASNAISGQHWKSLSWIAIFATPAFSWLFMYWIRQGIDPEDTRQRFRILPLHTIVLACSLLYPLCWWLAAVARRRGLSLAFGAATGILIPWLAIYGGYGTVPEPALELEQRTPRGSVDVTVTRKPLPSTTTGWLPPGDVFEVSGLKEGEHTSFIPELRQDDPLENRVFIRGGYVMDGRPPDPKKVGYFPLFASMKDGKIVWGERPVWEEIRKQMPPHESFDARRSDESLREGEIALKVPEAEVTSDSELQETPRKPHQSRQMTRSEFLSSEWEAWVGEPGKWRILTSCPADKGVALRLPEGGVLKVLPARMGEDGSWQVLIKIYRESLWQSGGSWRGREEWRYSLPRVLILDESGKHVDAARRSDLNLEEVMLGQVMVNRYDMGPRDTEHFNERNERVPKSKVFVFLCDASEASWTKQFLPVPKEIEDR